MKKDKKFELAVNKSMPFMCSIPMKCTMERNKLTTLADTITCIKNEIQLEKAQEFGADLKAMTKLVEDARKEATAPHLAAQREIKRICDEFIAPVAEHLGRIEGLASVFVAERQARLDREAEEQRQKLSEAMQTELSVGERILAIQHQLATAQGALRKRLERELEELEIDRSEAEGEFAEAAEGLADIPENKVAGASVTPKFNIKVTDVHKLYQAHRQCVELTPRIRAIEDLIRAGITDIPGVELTPIAKVSFRASNKQFT